MASFLSAFQAHMQAKNLSPITITDRMELLHRLDHDIPSGLLPATTSELEAWLARPCWKPATRYTYYSHMAAFFAWLIDTEHIDYSPVRHMTRPKPPDGLPNPVTDDELQQALNLSSVWWRRVIILAAYAGLRLSEITDLRRDRVTAKRIRVEEGKGGRDGFVPTSPEVWQLVEPVVDTYVITGQRGHELTGHVLGAMARRHFRSIGLFGVHLHRFRHWYATSLLEGGVDLATVSKLMRHRSVQTTMRYLLIADSRREAAVQLLPRFTVGGILPAVTRQDPIAA